MASLLKYTNCLLYLMMSLFVHGVPFAEESIVQTRGEKSLELECGEVQMRITAKREFFDDRRVPFSPEFLQVGENTVQQSSCRAASEGATPVSEMVISVGLQECGTESRVHGEWLVYSNQLVLFPAVIPISGGGLIVRGATTVVPLVCRYKRKWRVSGEPLTPTWLPMTSTITAFGLLHFSLRTMTDDWSSPRSSSVYQQGEAVLLEASVEAPLHPPLRIYVDFCVATLKPDPLSLPSYKFVTNHGCLVDSVVPKSSSEFLPREQDNRLQFSVQAFLFSHRSGDQMFINCHLRATLRHNPPNHLNKACFFHRATFSWRATEGDSVLCSCCDTENCIRQTGGKTDDHTGHTTQPGTGKEYEADTEVGPLHILPVSHWTGHLSVNH
ncbi:zona pellucida sperm-binding protein 3-like [Myripristis murdjan]|uniref:Zona pellucida sperm-binding protein 3 n=1 Tax=Myripristis murdjan TaxID=586833 RepID=A0A667XD29_9TELE|nr:zona pellucida sperm-binding protein 3-like [Myripristis murdjan]XP_029932873.1 zona pellucida sperm-binding protein 3-like [Myripristis murdjan]XP_029932874.1 zona pellucida sperm-binding protein 3-like [Myripristis murdjan]XP_029932875.1 zona pellucida sperm-binding protein 3-like [Myripristis murdjan]XP_029932876.1 zona pellucida sperm-binding protein 3-like [Myripristis murdjan]XP_029932878.1 zona pellucida sperm-binding protein 3-like [Myripristis murdjan]XP_029932879.1 zona pellucida